MATKFDVSARRSQTAFENIDAEQGAHVALVDDIRDRIFGKHFEERVERLAQSGIQAAGYRSGAIGSVVFEAFGHGEVFFGDANDVKEGDVFAGLPSFTPPLRPRTVSMKPFSTSGCRILKRNSSETVYASAISPIRLRLPHWLHNT